jgi:hypothetical protein
LNVEVLPAPFGPITPVMVPVLATSVTAIAPASRTPGAARHAVRSRTAGVRGVAIHRFG